MNRNVRTVLFVSVLFGASTGIYEFVLPYYLQERGLSFQSMGTIFAVAAAGMLLVRVVMGRLADVWGRKPDLEAALAGVPKGAFRLLLCHEPDYADIAAARRIPLQLSGHSHGGQVRLPLLGAPILPYLGRKYPIGLQRAGTSTLVYTNVGVGTIAPPVRFNCRPEVTQLTLRRG